MSKDIDKSKAPDSGEAWCDEQRRLDKLAVQEPEQLWVQKANRSWEMQKTPGIVAMAQWRKLEGSWSDSPLADSRSMVIYQSLWIARPRRRIEAGMSLSGASCPLGILARRNPKADARSVLSLGAARKAPHVAGPSFPGRNAASRGLLTPAGKVLPLDEWCRYAQLQYLSVVGWEKIYR
jgi:hypothetical protein